MRVLLKQLFTGKDNQTSDIGRVIWAVGALVFLALSIISYIQGVPFDYVAWGGGFAAVLAGGGAAIGLKNNSEPQATPMLDEETIRAKEIARRLQRRRNRSEDEAI